MTHRLFVLARARVRARLSEAVLVIVKDSVVPTCDGDHDFTKYATFLLPGGGLLALRLHRLLALPVAC